DQDLSGSACGWLRGPVVHQRNAGRRWYERAGQLRRQLRAEGDDDDHQLIERLSQIKAELRFRLFFVGQIRVFSGGLSPQEPAPEKSSPTYVREHRQDRATRNAPSAALFAGCAGAVLRLFPV